MEPEAEPRRSIEFAGNGVREKMQIAALGLPRHIGGRAENLVECPR